MVLDIGYYKSLYVRVCVCARVCVCNALITSKSEQSMISSALN